MIRVPLILLLLYMVGLLQKCVSRAPPSISSPHPPVPTPLFVKRCRLERGYRVGLKPIRNGGAHIGRRTGDLCKDSCARRVSFVLLWKMAYYDIHKIIYLPSMLLQDESPFSHFPSVLLTLSCGVSLGRGKLCVTGCKVRATIRESIM